VNTLEEFLRLLETAEPAINAEAARQLLTTLDDVLLPYAQAIAHRQSGNMAESMHRLGPFPTGDGAVEGRIESGAWYADLEVARGGDHDWVTRTLDEQSGAIDTLSAAIADRAVVVLTGGGR
jgi:hypothetical protein